MDTSRIPVSVTRNSPCLACKPANAWFTSPIKPTSSPITKTRGSLSRMASKQALRISRPSKTEGSSEYFTSTGGTASTLNSDSLYWWLEYLSWFSFCWLLYQLWSLALTSKGSVRTSNKAFRTVLITSILTGFRVRLSSWTIWVSSLFPLHLSANSISSTTASSNSFFIVAEKAFQALSLLSLTSCFASAFIWSNSSSEAILLDNIYSLNLTTQSYSTSHWSRSLLLYLSWDPEVECPWGWVISVTWTRTGTCCSLATLFALL